MSRKCGRLMNETLLDVSEMSFAYGTKKEDTKAIFCKLSMSVHRGDFVSILGPSGSGKSTFFRLVTGLDQPQEGRIVLQRSKNNERLGYVGYMPQSDLLMPWRTVLLNGMLPLELKGMNKQQAQKIVRQHLYDFGLQGTEHLYPHQLSGGMRQRVSFYAVS